MGEKRQEAAVMEEKLVLDTKPYLVTGTDTSAVTSIHLRGLFQEVHMRVCVYSGIPNLLDWQTAHR
jgi:hypothetical protein